MADDRATSGVTEAETIDLDNIHTDHTPSDLFKVGFVYGLGGGGVTAIIGVRFLVFGNGAQEHAAGIMFFVVSALMLFAGVWCHVKRFRMLRNKA
ncbi:MAG TPA: hypothetical protein PLB35_11295 [Myxococcota bacterium]|nr:hypothetical protein [Myxococcota bacterium]HOA14497.1 hypothetical protein [Myxococcota bacterium]HOH77828.1 hypothetical protein [Myxococcota bacterium]HPV04531.1 hypothetical protein [Myxococcota bacterium]